MRARGSGEWAGGGEADLRASLDISCRILEAVGRQERGGRGAGARWGRGSRGPGALGGSGVPGTEPGLPSL